MHFHSQFSLHSEKSYYPQTLLSRLYLQSLSFIESADTHSLYSADMTSYLIALQFKTAFLCFRRIHLQPWIDFRFTIRSPLSPFSNTTVQIRLIFIVLTVISSVLFPPNQTPYRILALAEIVDSNCQSQIGVVCTDFSLGLFVFGRIVLSFRGSVSESPQITLQKMYSFHNSAFILGLKLLCMSSNQYSSYHLSTFIQSQNLVTLGCLCDIQIKSISKRG